MSDFILVTFVSVLALLGHGAVKVNGLKWLIRALIVFVILFELSLVTVGANNSTFANNVLLTMVVTTTVILFYWGRKLISAILTPLDGVVSLRVLTGPIRHKMSWTKAINDWVMFIPTSFPHLTGMFIYITVLGYFMQNVNPGGFDFPAIPLPMPVQLSQIFSYNGLGLVLLSFSGVGLFVSRDWKSALKRLGWEKPTWPQVGVGVGLIVFSFVYDLLWSLYTHAQPGQDMATKISGYNSGTFATGGDLSASIVIALFVAICAGVGEETMTRGALQPALGIVPAAVMHGVLHAQFSHAPTLIIQVALWSIVFGIARRFTNTTTTMIGHCGFNFITTFLFAFNP
ncbi:CPBP family intramembrane metalloprotease [Candidatus Obscuribacterales bacterium]|nr:CPBP family intramembrane metalloprotease [Candidatus Obscuribacterales bacterium]MBX3152881.1 CPBP family intramembrane metalloprotease [Candidatus Obscuribacterales bacterium]